MKLKIFFLIVLIITVSGHHLLPNQSDMLPTLTDETPDAFETN